MTQSSVVSCIVPVYNGERFLREALDSIVDQSYGPLDIIVADDGSTDRTAELVGTYGERVRYLSQPNAGPAAARNLGLRVARGEFIAFLDADDLWHPEKLVRQMARVQTRPDLDACVTYQQNVCADGLSEDDARRHGYAVGAAVPGYSTQTLLARRRVFETVGLFNATMRQGEDTEWFLRARDHGVVIEVVADVLCYRRLHRNSLSWRLANTRDDHLLQIVKQHLDRSRRPSD